MLRYQQATVLESAWKVQKPFPPRVTGTPLASTHIACPRQSLLLVQASAQRPSGPHTCPVLQPVLSVQGRRQNLNPGVEVCGVQSSPFCGSHWLVSQHEAPSPPQMLGSAQLLHWFVLPLHLKGWLQVP